MTECAIMIALATVLSLISIWQMPFGGKLTLLSMLPIIVIGLRRGVRAGFMTAFMYSVVQLALSLGSVLSWGLTPVVLIACFFLDYIAAFTSLGICSFFRKGKNGELSRARICIGTALALFARFVCHYISGITLWTSSAAAEGISPYIYSALYNGAFMLPELVLTVAAIFILSSVPQFKRLLCAE